MPQWEKLSRRSTGKISTIMNSARDIYLQRIDKYETQTKKLWSKSKHVGWLKILTIIIGVVFLILLFLGKALIVSFVISVLSFCFFIALCVYHNKVENQYEHETLLLEINTDSLERVGQGWIEFPGKGTEWKPEEHSYAEDLDILGKASVFQYINTAISYSGQSLLAHKLLFPRLSGSRILHTQAAIAELAQKLDWRQHFQAMGKRYFKKTRNPGKIMEWAAEKEEPLSLFATIVFHSVPFLTITLAALSLFTDFISVFVALVCLLLHVIILVYHHKPLMKILNSTLEYKDSIKAYSGMIRLFELEKFSSASLNRMQKALISKQGKTTYQQAEKLFRIIERADIRHSSIYLFWNIISLWDIQVLTALKRWKHKYGVNIKKWIDMVAELECCCSFSILNFNFPDWCTPEIDDGPAKLESLSLGHPLLGGSAVKNDIRLCEPGSVILITGSNMSGKSTWLRSIGINLALAYNGSVVCAERMRCSLFKMHSVMRVKDDLEKGISSFYAELLKIKSILKCIGGPHSVFYLLDEIFKGTNSQDRHLGANVLIQTLSRRGAVGLVSTHDLALGQLAEKNSKIRNFHFQEYYQAGKIQFDYRLYPGISQSRNALQLMHMIGLEIDEDLLSGIKV